MNILEMDFGEDTPKEWDGWLQPAGMEKSTKALGREEEGEPRAAQTWLVFSVKGWYFKPYSS